MWGNASAGSAGGSRGGAGSDAAAGAALAAAGVAASGGRLKNALSMSIGTGKIVVELFSVAISVTVCR